MPADLVAIVAAYNEGPRIAATIAALRDAFPQARLLVADDASTDDTAAIASGLGAEVVTAPKNIGKGGANTLAAQQVLALAWDPVAAQAAQEPASPPVFLLCDGDLASTAEHLPDLVAEVTGGRADLAVGAFERRVGGGFGVAKGFARWAIRRRCGLELSAPISGQRALSAGAFRVAVPFAPGFGMEIGMTVDVARAGLRVVEVELPLAHRATGRTLRGFMHRGRQLRDFALVYWSRR